MMTETRSQNIVPFPKWTSVMERFKEQQSVPDSACNSVQYHSCAIIEWKKLIDSLRTKPISEQLNAVNDWGNSHPYVLDIVNWGEDDYWETPYEFMAVNGDCEDYAIAKYYSLRALGISADKLRVIIVQDLNLGGIIHAVLGVYDDDTHLNILDNQSMQIVPAINIYHYLPIYGLNEKSWFAYYPRYF
jgi:predicted transglutaminase-like cysteine proteinase